MVQQVDELTQQSLELDPEILSVAARDAGTPGTASIETVDISTGDTVREYPLRTMGIGVLVLSAGAFIAVSIRRRKT